MDKKRIVRFILPAPDTELLHTDAAALAVLSKVPVCEAVNMTIEELTIAGFLASEYRDREDTVNAKSRVKHHKRWLAARKQRATKNGSSCIPQIISESMTDLPSHQIVPRILGEMSKSDDSAKR